jgi:hypothetical protein
MSLRLTISKSRLTLVSKLKGKPILTTTTTIEERRGEKRGGEERETEQTDLANIVDQEILWTYMDAQGRAMKGVLGDTQ